METFYFLYRDGFLNIIQWFEKEYRFPDITSPIAHYNDCLTIAIECGHLTILQHAQSLKMFMPRDCFRLAAQYGHLNILKCLLAQRATIGNGYVSKKLQVQDVLTWVRADEFVSDKDTRAAAAHGGHLDSKQVASGRDMKERN